MRISVQCKLVDATQRVRLSERAKVFIKSNCFTCTCRRQGNRAERNRPECCHMSTSNLDLYVLQIG